MKSCFLRKGVKKIGAVTQSHLVREMEIDCPEIYNKLFIRRKSDFISSNLSFLKEKYHDRMLSEGEMSL